jgi:hypothetical protein
LDFSSYSGQDVSGQERASNTDMQAKRGKQGYDSDGVPSGMEATLQSKAKETV